MKLENAHISTFELLFSVLCFMQGTILRAGFIFSITRNDSWAMAFTGLLFTLPLVAIYAILLRWFPDKSLFEINNEIYGRILGKIVSFLYLFFFLSLSALNTWDLGNFVIGYMMPETPFIFIILFFLIVCVYAIHKGIVNLMRLSIIFCLLSVGAVVINSLLILNEVKFDFIKPFFILPFMKYVQGTISVAAVPMGEILAFTMIAPMMRKKKAGYPLAMGLILSALFMAIVMIRDIITLGPLVSIVSMPSFESVRYVSIAGILTRMESIYAVILLILFLFKVVILLYASVLGASQLLNLNSYKPLILLVTALVFLYSLFVFESVMDNMEWGASTAPFFSLTFEFLIPLVSLIVAQLRGLNKVREVKV